ncbi:MAG: ABC transporter permease [Burkholderiales bacterium]|nr:ABC transporter permease [Burkholderiales bacterium]
MVSRVMRRPGRKFSFTRSVLEPCAAALLALLILLVWQVTVPLAGISEFVLPTPWTILKRIVADWSLLLQQAWITVLEVVFGFGIAVLAGVPTALAVFYWRIFEKAVYPLLVALQTVPKIVLAPLLVLYLGYDWAPKIFLAFLISFFPIVIATVVGLQALEKPMINLLRSMGASEWQIFVKLRMPAALPNIFGGFKVGIGLAVIGAVIGEYVAAERGIGYLQLQANAKFDTALSFAAVVVISGVGVLLFSLISFIERKVVFQREAAR